MRLYRHDRLRGEMAKRGIDAVILSDPIDIRYASGTCNMQVFSMRNAPSRYLLLTANRAILFEFTGCLHLAHGYETLDEVRPASTASFAAAGHDIGARERRWAAETADLIWELLGRDATLGLERLNAGTAIALQAEGPRIVDAQEAVERARAIKSSEEMKCITASLRATEESVAALKAAIRPGITENEIWSHLHQSVIARNGDYCKTRLLSSRPRTNPWFQESSHRPIWPTTWSPWTPTSSVVTATMLISHAPSTSGRGSPASGKGLSTSWPTSRCITTWPSSKPV